MNIIYCASIITILLFLSLLLFSYMKNNKKLYAKSFKDLQIKGNYKNTDLIDDNTIAIISAAVAYYYDSANKSFKICSIEKHFYADNRL